jgi:hypothetical protein
MEWTGRLHALTSRQRHDLPVSAAAFWYPRVHRSDLPVYLRISRIRQKATQ